MKHGVENKYLRSMGHIENLNTVSSAEKNPVYFSRTDLIILNSGHTKQGKSQLSN